MVQNECLVRKDFGKSIPYSCKMKWSDDSKRFSKIITHYKKFRQRKRIILREEKCVGVVLCQSRLEM